ncbi:MAG: pilus assembly protein PilM [Oscillospiraceae bacterium]|nr:pilus assembly protein PilM [Candidatus Limimonas coprohippi]
MITSVFISNEKIQVLTGDKDKKGRLDVKACMYVTLPEKAVVNGVIADELGIKESIQKLWDKYNLPKRDISLVIDSGTILNKKITCPILPKASMPNVVQDEFKDVEGFANFLFDYTVIEDGKNGEPMLFANAVGKELIAAYVRVFNGLDIQLSRINTAINAEMSLVAANPGTSQDTEIVVNLDSINLTSVLYIDGKYSFASRSRIIEQRGTEGSRMEIVRALSSLIQFARSENSQKPVKAVYICGMTEAEADLCPKISAMLGCPVSTLPACDNITCTKDKNKAAFLMADYTYALGNML